VYGKINSSIVGVGEGVKVSVGMGDGVIVSMTPGTTGNVAVDDTDPAPEVIPNMAKLLLAFREIRSAPRR